MLPGGGRTVRKIFVRAEGRRGRGIHAEAQNTTSVTPAKAGAHLLTVELGGTGKRWVPAFAGMTWALRDNVSYNPALLLTLFLRASA